MNSNLTPTRHGAWRVIDGQLVDESEQPAAAGIPPADPAEAGGDAAAPGANRVLQQSTRIGKTFSQTKE